MSKPVRHFYEFGPFHLDARERVLRHGGRPVALAPKAFDTLLVLVERSGSIVAKDELMQRLWPDSFVEEGNLAFNISVLRKALAESGGELQFIETVPKRGYRFVASVREVWDENAAVVVEQQTTAHIIIEEVKEESAPASVTELGSPVVAIAPSPPALAPAASLFQRGRQRRALVIAAIVVGLAAIIYYWTASAPKQQTLAVLPFKPLAAESGDQYLELGMADALITKLSNIKQIIVRPTSSILKYATTGQDPLAVGRELGVAAVLDGSIQRVGDRIRVTVRLVRTSDGASLWAEKFDESFTNIFAVQDSISQRMADALTLRLTGEERKRLAKRYTDNTEAYQAYLKGRFYWSKWNRDALQKAIESFEQAIKLDPQYALAYSGLADSYNLMGYLDIWPPKEAFPKSEAAARKALEMDAFLSEAHLSLAKVKLFYDWDWPGFETEMQRALDLDPNYGDAHGMYGTYFTVIGNHADSIRERKRSQEIDPLSPLFTNSLGWSYYYARQYDQAIEWYKKAAELDPNFVPPHNDLATTYSKKGMLAEAVDEFLTAKRIAGARPETLAALRQAYTASGINGYWQKELELANEQAQQRPAGTLRMARIYTELGDRDRAFEWLEKAYGERHSLLVFLKVNPMFEALHSDPRFANLVQRIGLP